MKYNVKFACGHEAEVELFGKTAERERKIAYYEECGECPECYKERKAAERAAENEAAAEAAKERGLAELQGSPKQVAWATSIRAKWLERWERKAPNDKAMELVQAFAGEQTTAKFWIDGQYQGNTAAIDNIFMAYAKEALK